MKEYKKILDKLFLAEHRMQKILEQHPKFIVPKSVIKVFDEVYATFSTLNTALNIIDDEIEEFEITKLKTKDNERGTNKGK